MKKLLSLAVLAVMALSGSAAYAAAADNIKIATTTQAAGQELTTMTVQSAQATQPPDMTTSLAILIGKGDLDAVITKSDDSMIAQHGWQSQSSISAMNGKQGTVMTAILLAAGALATAMTFGKAPALLVSTAQPGGVDHFKSAHIERLAKTATGHSADTGLG